MHSIKLENLSAGDWIYLNNGALNKPKSIPVYIIEEKISGFVVEYISDLSGEKEQFFLNESTLSCRDFSYEPKYEVPGANVCNRYYDRDLGIDGTPKSLFNDVVHWYEEDIRCLKEIRKILYQNGMAKEGAVVGYHIESLQCQEDEINIGDIKLSVNDGFGYTCQYGVYELSITCERENVIFTAISDEEHASFYLDKEEFLHLKSKDVCSVINSGIFYNLSKIEDFEDL